MAGALIHIGVGLICALIVQLMHLKLEYSLAIFLGNLFPDALTFGVSGIIQGTMSIARIERNEFFTFLSQTTHNPNNWVVLVAFLIGLSFFLYHHHVLKKKTIREYDELYIFILIGIIIHLLLDVLVNEVGIWY